MNDPNGLVSVDGQLHVTYQFNPDAPRWGRMHWGHAISGDLVTWRHLPMALSPGDDGPDAFGCWSGSLVQDGATSVIFYTGVHLVGGIRRQSVCRAVSTDRDLERWTKDPDNPVIAGAPPGIDPELFRDPFVWRDEDRWAMLVGAGTTDGRGAVVLYTSTNLRDWTFAGTLLTSTDVDPAAGCDGPMWECPQLLRARDQDVLVVSVVDRAPGVRPSHVSALVGRLTDDTFALTSARPLSLGPDFYAPATTVLPDGRWLLIGWIPEDPPEPGSTRTWAGSCTFPRVVTVARNGMVSLALAPEIRALRGPTLHDARQVVVSPSAPWQVATPGGPFEVAVSFEPMGPAELVCELQDGGLDGPAARVAYRSSDRRIAVARRGIVSVAGRSSMSVGTIPEADGTTVHVRALVDGSILELEINGHLMATLRLSGSLATEGTLAFSAVGGHVRILTLDVWPLVRPGGVGGLRLAPPVGRSADAAPAADREARQERQ